MSELTHFKKKENDNLIVLMQRCKGCRCESDIQLSSLGGGLLDIMLTVPLIVSGPILSK